MSTTKVWRRPVHSWPLAVISLGVVFSFGWAMLLVWLVLSLLIV